MAVCAGSHKRRWLRLPQPGGSSWPGRHGVVEAALSAGLAPRYARKGVWSTAAEGMEDIKRRAKKEVTCFVLQTAVVYFSAAAAQCAAVFLNCHMFSSASAFRSARRFQQMRRIIVFFFHA